MRPKYVPGIVSPGKIGGTSLLILAGFVALCSGPQSAVSEAASPSRTRRATVAIIQLPEVKLSGSISVEDALAKQQTVRRFSGQSLKPAQIGQLAWAGLGARQLSQESVAAPFPSGAPARAPQAPAPAIQPAPADYPISLYLVTQDGIFIYNPGNHSMQQLLTQDVRGNLAAATNNREAVGSAGACFVLATQVRNVGTRVSARNRQTVLFQAGQAAQSIALQAVSLELGSVLVGDFDANALSRICNLPRALEPICLIAVGLPVQQGTTAPLFPAVLTNPDIIGTTPVPSAEPTPPVSIGGQKTAVLIVPSQNFQDQEFSETKRVLEAAGVQTSVASTKTGKIIGAFGKVIEAEFLVKDIKIVDYDAFVFIGGVGTKEYFRDFIVFNIVREAMNNKKVVAAISTAPAILANAGLLRGVRATSSFSERVDLANAGARYTTAPVERDGLIITANGPLAAGQFGKAIADALASL